MSDREKQLLAVMTRDAAEFAKRELGRAALIGDDDKIAKAKRAWEIKKLNRKRQQRIAAGLTVRKAKWPIGTWASGERRDGFKASDGLCIVCGKPINRDRSRTCSPACARAVRSARKAIVNHGEGGAMSRRESRSAF